MKKGLFDAALPLSTATDMFRLDLSHVSGGAPITRISFDPSHALSPNTLSGSDRIIEVTSEANRIDAAEAESSDSCELTAHYTWSDGDGGRNIAFSNGVEMDLRFCTFPEEDMYFLKVTATRNMSKRGAIGTAIDGNDNEDEEKDPTRNFIFVLNTDTRSYELRHGTDDLRDVAGFMYEVREDLVFSDASLNREGRDMFLNR